MPTTFQFYDALGAILVFVTSIYILLLSYGYIRLTVTHPKRIAMWNKCLPIVKIITPIMVVFTLINLISTFMQA